MGTVRLLVGVAMYAGGKGRGGDVRRGYCRSGEEVVP